MFRLLVEKELKHIIQSSKFALTFGTCSLLILLSIGIGINEYHNSVKQYNAATNLNTEEMMMAKSWMMLSTKAFRQPNPFQVFTFGVNNDVGRFSTITSRSDVKLQSSVYSDDPIFAIFQQLDYTAVVAIVLALFAILFTFNSINGEKEGGTLRLVFSNSIPRSTYIASKFVGSWLGLIVPLLIPILIGLLMVVVFKVPLTGGDWAKVLMLIFMSVIYLTLFIALGIFVSSLTKYSSVSFLVLLVAWIMFVFVTPRIGIAIASQIDKVPSIAEVESQKDAYSKTQWNKLNETFSAIWEKRNEIMKNMSDVQRTAYQDENSYAWLEEEDKIRKDMDKNIADYSAKLSEELVNKKNSLEKNAFAFSRISPASLFFLGAMNLSGTNINLKNRYEKSMADYKKSFAQFTDKKQKEDGGQAGMIRITFDSKSGFSMNQGRQSNSLDFKEVPKYVDPNYTFAQAMQPSIIDLGLLLVYSLISFGGAYLVFLRYDLR